MRVTVKNPIRDLAAFALHLRKRNRRFRRARADSITAGVVDRLSKALHPPVQRFTVSARIDQSPTTATFRLSPADTNDRVAFFRAGQYVSVEADVDGVRVSRPFSISSPPDDSYRDNYYDITVRASDDGFLAPWIMEEWRPGSPVYLSDPQGYFYYETLRDARFVVCLAGGSGITPFRAIIPDLLTHQPDVRILLLYGITSADEIIFAGDWSRLLTEHSDRFSFVPVHSGQTVADWAGETGLITADLIRANTPSPTEASFFICGPQAMHQFVESELDTLQLKARQIRRENFGDGVRRGPGARSVSISVEIEGREEVLTVPASLDESVLVALERAGLNPPALCRSGDCGWCRGQLKQGTVRTPERTDHRRAGDRKFGYFHPCASWPETDLTIRVPRNPKNRDGG